MFLRVWSSVHLRKCLLPDFLAPVALWWTQSPEWKEHWFPTPKTTPTPIQITNGCKIGLKFLYSLLKIK